MFAPAAIQQLSGERLHLSHGPIDVVLKAWGKPQAARAAYAAAGQRFPAILPELATSWPRCGRRSRSDARSTARGAADGRGLPALRGSVRHTDGGGGWRRRRRAAGVHDRGGGAGARLSSTTVATSPCWSRRSWMDVGVAGELFPRRNAGHQRQRPPPMRRRDRWHRHIGRGRALLLARRRRLRDHPGARWPRPPIARQRWSPMRSMSTVPPSAAAPRASSTPTATCATVGDSLGWPARPRRDRHALAEARARARLSPSPAHRRRGPDAARPRAARSAIGPAAPGQPYLCPRNFSTSSRVG